MNVSCPWLEHLLTKVFDRDILTIFSDDVVNISASLFVEVSVKYLFLLGF